MKTNLNVFGQIGFQLLFTRSCLIVPTVPNSISEFSSLRLQGYYSPFNGKYNLNVIFKEMIGWLAAACSQEEWHCIKHNGQSIVQQAHTHIVGTDLRK